MAQFNKKNTYKPTLEQKVQKILKDAIQYPKRIYDRYQAYNAGLNEMFLQIDDKNLYFLKARNARLVNIFIILPTFLGLLTFMIMIYFNRYEFIDYFNTIISPLKGVGIFKTISALFNRISYMIFKFPLGIKIIKWVFIGYFGSIIGAYILSLNPVFKKEEEIRKIFSNLGYVDMNGDPWKLTWTPNAIMINSFNCDPESLVYNNRFWSSINFPPSAPKKFKEDMKKFIVMRRHELPNKLVFNIKEKDL